MDGIADPLDGPVRFAVFGGVRVVRCGTDVELTQPKQRAILAMLLVAPGEAVQLSEFIDWLWPGEPAASAINQIQRRVGELRRAFEPGLGRRQSGRYLLPAGTGYRLVATPDDCDVLRFRRLIAEARQLAAAGQRESALRCYMSGLTIASAPAGDERLWALPSFVGLEDERVRAIVATVDECDSLDDFAAVLPFLRAATGRHRLDEALHARLMTALTRTGRSAEALTVYMTIREALKDELGASPSAVLEAAQARSLRDGEQPTPRTRQAATVTSMVAPAQLPSAAPGFVGRSAALAGMRDVLRRGPAPVLIAGMAGVGKTTLALRYANELAEHFPDGQLFVNLRGFDATAAPTAPRDALRDLLEGVGVPAQGQPESVDARSGLLRSILSRKRVLVVLDNAHDYQQVTPLLPGPGATQVIITSRNRLPGLAAFHQVQTIQLEPFDEDEVAEFFSQRLPPSLAADRDAMIRLGQACGGLPLALAIVGARAPANPAFPLDLFVREFTQERTRLASLNAGSAELDLGTVFSWSYRALSEDAARTFVFLSVHPGPEISTASAVSISGFDVARAREVLTELTLASVLRELRPGRFIFHDLVREYAMSLLGDNAAEASARLVDHYLRSTRNANLTFGRPPLAPVDETILGIEAEWFASDADAILWYVEERPVLRAAFTLALRSGGYQTALLLWLDSRPMRERVDAVRDMVPFVTMALTAAEHIDELVLKAECFRDAGTAFARLEREQARKYFDLALALFVELGDQAGQANVYRSLVLVSDDPKQREQLARKSVAIARPLDNKPILATSLYSMGVTLYQLGHFADAVDAFSECLAIATTERLAYCELEARVGIVSSLTATHDYEMAIKHAEGTHDRLRREGRLLAELDLLLAYGTALMEVGRDGEAIEAWKRFLAIATPELVQDALNLRTGGDDVIADLRTKLAGITSAECATSQ